VIEHDTPFPYQVDGDALGSTRRLEFSHVPDAVQLVFPTVD
jgi:diacylglycerol kinase family enzyme